MVNPLNRALAVTMMLSAVAFQPAEVERIADRAPPVALVRIAMACSNTTGSLSPCSATATVNAGSSANIFAVTLTNKSSRSRTGSIACAISGVVSSCALSTNSYSLPSHGTLVVTAQFGASSPLQPASGSVTVTTGGGLGTLSAKLTVNVTPQSACLPIDPKSTRLLAWLQDLAVGPIPEPDVPYRAVLQLPTLASASQVQQITSGSLCARAASAFDSVVSVRSSRPRNPNLVVYLFQYGNLYVVGDRDLKQGEYFPMMIFSSTFGFVDDAMF
jgi:hypothetical protein